MLKVAFDTSPLLSASKYRGIGRYSESLIKALKKTKRVDLVEINNKNSPVLADIVHYPFFDFFFLTLPFFKKTKTIVTIHDCIPLVFPRQFPPGIRGELKFNLQRLSLKGVSGIITDSQSSKKDIIKFLAVNEDKIFPVYLAAEENCQKLNISEGQKKNLFKKYGLKNDFILYAGDVNYNKNLPGLLRAFSCQKTNLDLVLIGKAFENSQQEEIIGIKKLIGELKIKDRVKILGFVSSLDLIMFYNLAFLYCQPSFYEGFGLQILEAMTCGTPVLTSNISSLPEVAGDAAFLIDPNKVEDIAKGMEKLILDRDLRSDLIKRGFEQVKKFSWEKTALQTIQVYEKILAK